MKTDNEKLLLFGMSREIATKYYRNLYAADKQAPKNPPGKTKCGIEV